MIQNPVKEIRRQLGESSKETGLTTGQVRSVSSNVFKLIEDKNIENVLNLGERLLEERKWELGVIAYDWAYRVKKQYTTGTFQRFEQWLKEYVRGWGDCDDFCTHAFGQLLGQYNNLFDHVLKWTGHPDFWVRRASAVILIYPIRKGMLHEIDPFTISDTLMHDEHHLVLKGYGWMLKELSRSEPDQVYQYVMKNRSRMPRVSLRYAIEKFDKDKRAVLMEKYKTGSIPIMTEIPEDALAVWRKPDRAISPVAIVATVDADGSARTAPFGSLRAVTSRLLRFATARYHDTYLNLCRDNRITVAMSAPPDIALTVRGRARVVKEAMDSYEGGVILEVDVEEVKNDMVRTVRLDSGITITSQPGFEWWFDGVIGEMETLSE